MNIEWAKLLLPPFVYLIAIAFAVYLIWCFRLRLRRLLAYLGVKNLKVAGVEISMSSAEIDKAQDKAKNNDSIKDTDVEKRSELAMFAEIVTPYIVGSRVLWVDDNPLFNREERRAFRLLGIEVKNCLNTSEAIETLCRDDYDVVISDIGRGSIPDSNACAEVEVIRRAKMEGDNGWKTLSEINKVHDGSYIPVIFYHGSLEEEEKKNRDNIARAEGAVGATTSPAILYRWVLSVLLQKAIIRDDELRHLIMFIPREVTRRLTSNLR